MKETKSYSKPSDRKKKIGALWLAPIFLLCLTLVVFTFACRPYIDFAFSVAKMFLVDERLQTSSENLVSAQGKFPSFNEEFGKIIIEKIGAIAPIYQGDTEEIIGKGAGHFYGSALPGEGSNVVISAHRNTFFARLGELTAGDLITLDTVGGEFVYRMVDSLIIDDHQQDYIMPTPTEVLSLMTCYPFDFIGITPQRYLVRCELVSGPQNAWGGN